MDTLRVPVAGMPCIQEASERIRLGKTPVNLWGVSGTVLPLVMEVLRRDSEQLLVVAKDESAADRLAEDYRFYNREVYIYPAKDVLFYYADVHGNLAARKRLEIIKRLQDGLPTVVILTVEGLMDRIPAPEMIRKNSLTLSTGEEIRLTAVGQRLTEMGYESVPSVELPGQFSIHGGILDIFPLTEDLPVRAELWGDEITSLRAFDAVRQRSVEEIHRVEILPATEFVLDPEMMKRGMDRIEKELAETAEQFKKTFHTEQYARIKKAVQAIREDMEDFAGAANVDTLVNFFYDETVSFLDYLPEGTGVYIQEPGMVAERARVYFEQFRMAMESRLSGGYILPGQADILFSDTEILERLIARADAVFTEFIRQDTPRAGEPLEFHMQSMVSYGGRISEMIQDLKDLREKKQSVLIFSPSRTRGRRLAESLNEEGVPAFFSQNENRVLKPGEVMVTTGALESGFALPEAGFTVLTEAEVFRRDKKKTRRSYKRFTGGEELSHLGELSVGDYVVHERHGIGVYKGIEQVETDGRMKDYINIEYADGGKLFIPVDQLSVIGKYADKSAAPPKLNKLSGSEWEKTRSRVRRHVDDMAEELINLYAARLDRPGHQYPEDSVCQTESSGY